MHLEVDHFHFFVLPCLEVTHSQSIEELVSVWLRLLTVSYFVVVNVVIALKPVPFAAELG